MTGAVRCARLPCGGAPANYEVTIEIPFRGKPHTEGHFIIFRPGAFVCAVCRAEVEEEGPSEILGMRDYKKTLKNLPEVKKRSQLGLAFSRAKLVLVKIGGEK